MAYKNLRSNNEKYEYKIEYFDDNFYNIELNRLGNQGWKVVGSRRAKNSDDYGYELILMR